MVLSRHKPKGVEYALVVVLVLIGFFIGLLIGGSGGYFLSGSGNSGQPVTKTVTKYQCANGAIVDSSANCPAASSASACVNQTTYIYRNESVFLPCNCLRDCGVANPSTTTTTTVPQKPKTLCSSDRDCGTTNTSGIKCSVTNEAYRLLITPKCLLESGVTQGYCIEEQSKEVVRQCGADNPDEICKPGVGCFVQAPAQ